MRLGVSHQRPEQPTPEHLAYLRQIGVEALEVRTVEAAGLALHEVMINDFYNCPEIAAGRPQAEDDLAVFASFLRDLA